MRNLTIEDLTSGYADVPIVKGCFLEAKEKETLVLMGPSGCGKTTLLLTILGFLTPMQGKIILNEKDISSVEIEKRNIGYLPQDYGLFPHLNVEENIVFGLRVRGASKKEKEQAAKEMLRLVNLDNYEKKKINELSGGEKQRIGLARALAVKPDLLLLDEPLSNIDQVTKGEVAMQLKKLFDKLQIPIILVTHSHEDARFLAKKLAIMIDGKIEQIGSFDEIKMSPKNEFIKRLLNPFA